MTILIASSVGGGAVGPGLARFRIVELDGRVLAEMRWSWEKSSRPSACGLAFSEVRVTR